MNDEAFLQIQTIELQRLLNISSDDPVLAPQLQKRLANAEQELAAAKREPGTLIPKETPILPRAAVFLRGGGVQGSEGISPSLAGEVLTQYEKMFVAQALHDERIAANTAGRKRRPRGASTPELLFTGTPRGSFGLEFVPRLHEDPSLLNVHSQSLVHIAESLTKVAGSDQTTLNNVVSRIPSGVLKPLKQLLRALALHKAELRFAFQDRPSQSISATQIETIASYLDHDVNQETVEISGTFRGVARESGVFDLRVSEDKVITCEVDDNLTEDDLERIDALTNQEGVAHLERITVSTIAGIETVRYVLLDAKQSTP
jgi:hypothetical protein